MHSLLEFVQPFFDVLDQTMKQLFIEQNGQTCFDHKYPSGGMELVWLAEGWELHVSKALLYFFMDDIEMGKNERSWLCIRIHDNQLSLYLKPCQVVMQSTHLDSEGMDPAVKEEVLGICSSFDSDVSIPILFVVDTPSRHQHVVELFVLPWSSYNRPVRIPGLPPLYKKVASAHLSLCSVECPYASPRLNVPQPVRDAPQPASTRLKNVL